MSDIPSLLLASLSPQTRKQAEQSLQTFSLQPSFVNHLLELVLNPAQDRAVRLAGSVYLKNVVKLRWLPDDDSPIADRDKESLRSQLVPAMIALSNPSDKGVRAQIAEAVSLIAQVDFPDAWPNLVEQLVASLNPQNFDVNVGVLETAHSIFRRWRSQARSNELFSTIILVINKFSPAFLQLFRFVAQRLFTTPLPPQPELGLLAQSMALLVDIYYDLTCQDLHPVFEDGHDEFFNAQTGYFMKLMAWDPKELHTEPDEPTPSLPSKIRTNILELAEMYVKLYPEVLARSQSVEALVRAVWELIGGGQQLGISHDPLVSQSLRFISTAIRSGSYKDLFSSRDTISGLIQGVVVPNVGFRQQDLEAFEDSPLEYIRGDLLLTEIATPRQAAGDVIKALVASGLEVVTTEIVGEWIKKGLDTYSAQKGGGDSWKSKDSAIYLFESAATRGGTTSHGVTSTNALLDVVKFFSDSIFADLQGDPGSVHPVLQVDAIRYLYTFRNGLTKEQLLSVIPLLARHLGSENTVVHTYAAIAIDRILFIRVDNKPMFAYTDIRDVAPELLNMLFRRIESGASPEKVAENDFLMRCVMRIIITARQTLAEGFEALLLRLVAILGTISRNPSNPHFDQYIFESISALIRFIGPANPASVPVFERTLFGPFTVILQQDIDQYIPYVFQILAQMLELHAGVPTDYRALLPILLTPAIWQQKGSIPGLVQLLKAFLDRDAVQMATTGQFTSVLAVVQQRLIPSKLNDGWGFELLQAVVRHIPASELQQYFRPIVVTLLTRLQTSKTDTYVYHFVYFLLYTMAINAEVLGPDFVVRAVEEVQPGRMYAHAGAQTVGPAVHELRHPAGAQDAAEGPQSGDRRPRAAAHAEQRHDAGAECPGLVSPPSLCLSPSLSLSLSHPPIHPSPLPSPRAN
ncbi:hypothetical protein EVG20_g9663 [Dentipellis fragilis]|uniref:Importin N-terminal domain-containing protein n=1 Tax=Dentipellis fragilis TaxID=205917 RepID=A0A4Y9Y120_9AGAM|nr:hypothetical protein EVG20_g9663 [Dentipellis fragilis]